MSETVCCACKLPNGLFLDISTPTKRIPKVELKGANDKGAICGYGITENVEKAFWDEWFKRYADNPMVKGGFVFAQGSRASVESKARNNKDLKTGYEPLDPNNLPKGIKQADREAA